MPAPIDLTGKQFGDWVVLCRVGATYKKWRCRCACGVERDVNGGNLRYGYSTGCGCGARRRLSERFRKEWTSLPEHRVWKNMRNRCLNPNGQNWDRYGGRGITIDPAWSSFDQFLADMGPRPSPNHTLERVDNDGPYSPENCYWATRKEQARNRSITVTITFDGETRPVSEWAELRSIPYSCLIQRVRWGWDPARALTEPVQRAKPSRSVA